MFLFVKFPVITMLIYQKSYLVKLEFLEDVSPLTFTPMM